LRPKTWRRPSAQEPNPWPSDSISSYFPYRTSERRTLTVKQMEQKKIPSPCSRIPLSSAVAERGQTV
jgi:hypothetical protein